MRRQDCAEGPFKASDTALLLRAGIDGVSFLLTFEGYVRAVGDDEEAASHLVAARAGFEALLAKHPLAFADHAAEFYLGSGGDARRAFELARLNLANRPTVRAFELYADASDRVEKANARPQNIPDHIAAAWWPRQPSHTSACLWLEVACRLP